MSAPAPWHSSSVLGDEIVAGLVRDLPGRRDLACERVIRVRTRRVTSATTA